MPWMTHGIQKINGLDHIFFTHPSHPTWSGSKCLFRPACNLFFLPFVVVGGQPSLLVLLFSLRQRPWPPLHPSMGALPLRWWAQKCKSQATQRLRIRDFASCAAIGENKNRILEWSEILMGLEDNSIELQVEMPESDGYIGNPEDYVDSAGYEALLQNLAESDGGLRRGAPPAARLAVSALEILKITLDEDVLVCAICKESVPVGETAKKVSCGHGYHGDCIVPLLGSRNSCPVCRFELPTDDPEYEEERKKRSTATTAVGPSGSGSNNTESG